MNTADPSVTGLDKVLGDEFVPRAGQTFNYNPTNFFQRPDERLNVGFFGDYQVTDTVEAYASVRSMRSESNAQIAYSGTFGNITALPCYNPLLSTQQYDTVCVNWAGMGGDHAPDFPSSAAALSLPLHARPGGRQRRHHRLQRTPVLAQAQRRRQTAPVHHHIREHSC